MLNPMPRAVEQATSCHSVDRGRAMQNTASWEPQRSMLVCLHQSARAYHRQYHTVQCNDCHGETVT